MATIRFNNVAVKKRAEFCKQLQSKRSRARVGLSVAKATLACRSMKRKLKLVHAKTVLYR
ncbi:hypothetical protein T4B_3071 [Trichinella pseudospiralis]|uniref:Uncharacterized protein n=1 Tax=Trichinella pseudospiralis TaxID=6337 RepID=A0A0V1I9R3_TRIPS|nr:hypothetical protein T4B_3071 [Trichinella pseudospiralis]